MEFFQTAMGRKFYEGTMPALARNIKALTEAVDKNNAVMAEALNALRGSGKPAGNELMIALAEGWVYYKTSAGTVDEALKELEEKGINFDNLKNFSAYLRDQAGEDIDERSFY